MRSKPGEAWLRAVVVVGTLAVGLAAQCRLQALPGSGAPGLVASVTDAARWDPDGSGPLPELLVLPVGSSVVAFDPVTGSITTLGGATFNLGRALAVVPMANGDLVVVGDFQSINVGSTVFNISSAARWNGTIWSGVGNSQIAGIPLQCAAQLANGDLIAGTNGTVRSWNGTTWTTLGAGTVDNVTALAALPGGGFAAGWTRATTTPTGPLFDCTVATWNGTTWTALGSSPGSAILEEIHDLTTTPNGDLIVAGSFSILGGTVPGSGGPYLARWNGTTWSSLGTGVDGPCNTALVLASGELIVGGAFTNAGGIVSHGIARWNGSAWSQIGAQTPLANVNAILELPGGGLFACDQRSTEAANFMHWDGAIWSPFLRGTDGAVRALQTMPDGSIVAGGAFNLIDGVVAANIARWDGVAWAPLAAGIGGGLGSYVAAIAEEGSGGFVVGGLFQAAGGAAASNVARWNGTSWLPLGTGTPADEPVRALAVLANGDIAAAVQSLTGTNRLYRWNGATWTQIATANQTIETLVTLPNGDLLVGGAFTTIGGFAANRVARWNSVAWSALGAGPGSSVPGFFTETCYALLPEANGSVIAAGLFTNGGFLRNPIVRWDGTNWTTMGSGRLNDTVYRLQRLPDGDVLALGLFVFVDAAQQSAGRMARWNGTDWFATGVSVFGVAQASALGPRGELSIGGSFFALGTTASTRIGRIASTCPALASPVGAGCPSSGGSNTLRADTLPWTGGSFRVTATGLPSNAVAMAALGTTPLPQGAVPLAALFAQGVPGCDVLVVPDEMRLLAVNNGATSGAAQVPDVPALIGMQFRVQLGVLELDTTGAIVAITATNALQLTVGQF